MTQIEFNQALAAFDQGESMRAQLYYRALDLIQAGFVIDAHLLILATWNFARFRYVTRDFDLQVYQQTLTRLSELLHPLNGCELMTTDLAQHRDRIIEAFSILSAIEGIRYTGAAKILHLLYPHYFVMWDRFYRWPIPETPLCPPSTSSSLAFGHIADTLPAVAVITPFSSFARSGFATSPAQAHARHSPSASTNSTSRRLLIP